MGLHIADGGVHGVQVMTVEHIDAGAHHFQMAELLGCHVEKQVLDLRVFNAHALGQVLQGAFQLALRAAQLLLQQRSVIGVRPIHPHRMQVFLFMLEHRENLLWCFS